MRTTDPPDSRHRTSDLWEAATLWANGWPVVETERDGSQVIFIFPDGGDGLTEDVQAHRGGKALVPTLALRQGYYEMRHLMDRELRDAGSR